MKTGNILKKAFAMLMAGGICLAACQKYELDVNFAAPEKVEGPNSVELDVTSSAPVVFTWNGGGAEDGGIVLYEVLFDTENGDFSNPVAVFKSDLGAMRQLSLTHSQLNIMAREAGVKPETTGKFRWTVRASKGGVVKMSGASANVSLTRGEGIDNIPSVLYLRGTATENNGAADLEFRTVEKGIYQIYTTFPKNGNIKFMGKAEGEGNEYFFSADASGKLKEDDTAMSVSKSSEVVRITVDFNTLAVKYDEIGTEVRLIWACNFDNVSVLKYTSNGRFSGEGDIKFVQSDRPDTNPPSWLGWVEERYYFIAQVNGGDMCWGRHDSVSAERPVGGEPASFYSLYEFAWSQWDHCWKMNGSLDMKHATITIDTNKDGLMLHTFTNIKSL